MKTVSDDTAIDWQDSATNRPAKETGVDTVERYETAEGVVFFDANNPLAWVEATQTVQLNDLV